MLVLVTLYSLTNNSKQLQITRALFSYKLYVTWDMFSNKDITQRLKDQDPPIVVFLFIDMCDPISGPKLLHQ